jgi:hypothetical protein
MNSSRRQFLETGAKVCAAAIVWTSNATAADTYVPFQGEKTTWHEGFERYDFIMDGATGTATPMTAPASEVTIFGIDVSLNDGKRRCVVVVPKSAAPGNPWSWQACYWNHQPQTEVELLRRGFHIAFVAPDPRNQGKPWDLWYKFMTETHGLAKKPAFVGMSKGGVNEFDWGVVNADKVACIYADNPALWEEDFSKFPELAKQDIPLLHIVGTEDFVLRYTQTLEKIYHTWGGSLTLIMKEGIPHHPHSLSDPTPIADWIERHLHPAEANRPAFADSTFTKTHYYSLENSYIYLKDEDTYATVRGPGYVPSYDCYTSPGRELPSITSAPLFRSRALDSIHQCRKPLETTRNWPDGRTRRNGPWPTRVPEFRQPLRSGLWSEALAGQLNLRGANSTPWRRRG